MPPGKLDLSKSIFAQPPPEVPTSASKNRKLSVTEQLSELQKLTAEQEASYAAKKADGRQAQASAAGATVQRGSLHTNSI